MMKSSIFKSLFRILLFVGVLMAMIKLYSCFNADTEKFSEEGKKVVFVYADWCGHCTKFKEEWSKFEEKCKEMGIKCEALNVDDKENDDFLEKHDVNSFPTLLVFKGTEVVTYEGDRTANDLLSFVEAM